MLFLVLRRNDQALRHDRHDFHSLRSRPGLRGGSSQLAAPSGPRPQTLTKRRPWRRETPGTQPSHRLLRLPRGRGQSHRPQSMQTVVSMRGQRRGWGTGSLPPQGLGQASGWPWWGLWSPAEHHLRPVSWATLFPTCPRQGEPQEKPGSISNLTPPEDNRFAYSWLNRPLMVVHWQLLVGGAHCGTDQWLSRATNGCCLTVGLSWEGPLWHQPMVEQGH